MINVEPNIEEKKDDKPTINEKIIHIVKIIYINDFIYSDPNIQKFCHNKIYDHFSKKRIMDAFTFSYRS